MRVPMPERLDLVLAAGLTAAIAGEALARADGASEALAGALAAPAIGVPLAWRRTLPPLPLAALIVALVAQEPAGGALFGGSVSLLAALLVVLYSAGRYVADGPALVLAATGVVALALLRIAFDPAVERAVDVVGTLLVVPLPALVGRAVRAHAALADELAAKARRLERDRARDERLAVDEERARIARELQGVVAAEVEGLVADAAALPAWLERGDRADAGEALGSIAARARVALAEIRRALGILRRDGAPELTPAGRDRASGGDAPPTPAPEPAAGPPRRRTRRPAPALLDRALAGAYLLAAVAELTIVASGGARPFAWLTALPVAAALLWRRRRPAAAAVLVLGAIAVQSALLDLDAFPASSIGAVIAASYAVGAYAGRREALAGLALAAAGAVAHAAAFHPDGVLPALIGGVAVPWTLGRILQSRRRLRDELVERAARAERERERGVRSAVAAERTRVARELHDVVAHGLSVMAIQAGGAQRVAARDPRRAAEAAALIERVGREALVELGHLLVAEPDGAAPARPGMARVDELAGRARAEGLPVDLRVEGDPVDLPAGVDLAAYRILQEALANASAHAGDARAWVTVRYGERAIELEVTDDGRGPGAPANGAGTGHGLIGMRERAALYGGAIDAGGRPGGGFRVHARLPLGQA